jgi:hypothetical protein
MIRDITSVYDPDDETTVLAMLKQGPCSWEQLVTAMMARRGPDDCEGTYDTVLYRLQAAGKVTSKTGMYTRVN